MLQVKSSALRQQILGVPVDVQTLDEALELLQRWCRGDQKTYVSTCTVYTIMNAQDDPAVMQALLAADMVTADGMPLVWMQRTGGFRNAERVYGPDILLALCANTQRENIGHFFMGGTPGVAEQLVDNLKLQFPELHIAGVAAPSVDHTSLEVDAQAVASINASNASIVWVGLGSPKQDVWMHTYRPYLNAPLLIGVGAAFDFVSGSKRQAPLWMQRSGLEWLFRLLQEPGRLWKRYLVYNPRFLAAILWSMTRNMLRRP
jgi:N-acetylglucosaminyldiphosphoundecaprenol N-acetyl-beta-D-mannosaminyltransferase